MRANLFHVVSISLDTVTHCYIIALTVPPNFESGSGPASVTPPAATIICGQDFETVSLSGFLVVQITCNEFNGSNADITAYKDGVEISRPVQFGPIPPPDDSVFGTYTFVSENECGRDVAISRVIRQGQLYFICIN